MTMVILIRLAIFGCLATSLIGAEPAKPPVFAIRLVVDKPAADSEEMRLMRQSKEGRSVPEVLQVRKGALLDDLDVKSADVQADPRTGSPEVGITFTDQGRKAFAEITRTNLNRRLAILIDGKVTEAPTIKAEIPDGKAIIEGNFTQKEAEDISRRINKAVQAKQKGTLQPWRHGLYDGRRVK